MFTLVLDSTIIRITTKGDKGQKHEVVILVVSTLITQKTLPSAATPHPSFTVELDTCPCSSTRFQLKKVNGVCAFVLVVTSWQYLLGIVAK